MNEQKNVVNNDETRLDTNDQAANDAQAYEKNTNETNGKSISPTTKNSDISKGVILGGIGILAGAIGTAGLMAFRKAPSMENPDVVGSPSVSEPESLGEIKLAHSPDDAMSFNEAFAAARAEVGANGVFEWRGNVYGTYYANEWESFSDEYKAQFNNHDWRSEFANDPQHIAHHSDHVTEPTSGSGNMFGDIEIKTDENGDEYILVADAVTGEDVRISPEDLRYAVLDEYGQLIAVVNEDVLAELNEYNDQPVYVEIDADGNIVDYVDYGNEEIIEYVYSDDDDVAILNLNDVYEAEEYILPEIADGQSVAIIDEIHDYDSSAIHDEDHRVDPQDFDTSDCLADNSLPDYANDASVDEFMI